LRSVNMDDLHTALLSDRINKASLAYVRLNIQHASISELTWRWPVGRQQPAGWNHHPGLVDGSRRAGRLCAGAVCVSGTGLIPVVDPDDSRVSHRHSRGSADGDFHQLESVRHVVGGRTGAHGTGVAY